MIRLAVGLWIAVLLVRVPSVAALMISGDRGGGR